MSSHHFVKEGQEPALFIVDPFSFELVQPLLEWAPLVMVLDSALDEVIQWGIKIDVILAVSDQIGLIREKVLEQMPVEIISYDNDEHVLQTGFYFLINNKQSGVNVMIGSNDASIFSFLQDLSSKLNVALLNQDLKWSFIETGEYKKWFPTKARIKIKCLDDKQKILLQGANRLEHESYETTIDGQVIIQSDNSFWIGEPFA